MAGKRTLDGEYRVVCGHCRLLVVPDHRPDEAELVGWGAWGSGRTKGVSFLATIPRRGTAGTHVARQLEDEEEGKEDAELGEKLVLGGASGRVKVESTPPPLGQGRTHPGPSAAWHTARRTFLTCCRISCAPATSSATLTVPLLSTS